MGETGSFQDRIKKRIATTMQLPPSPPSLTTVTPLRSTQQKTQAPSLNEYFSALKNVLPKEMIAPSSQEDTAATTGLTEDINDINTVEHEDVTQTHIIEGALKYIQFIKERELQLQKSKEALQSQLKRLVDSGIDKPEE